jgi:hypothetical protein
VLRDRRKPAADHLAAGFVVYGAGTGGETMYSPKINTELIPILYHQAKAKKLTMTKLVDRVIRGYLEADKNENAEPTTEASQ